MPTPETMAPFRTPEEFLSPILVLTRKPWVMLMPVTSVRTPPATRAEDEPMADPAPLSAPSPVDHVAHGWINNVLHRVQVWTEAEWAALPADAQPAGAQILPGLGYIRIAPALDPSDLPAA